MKTMSVWWIAVALGFALVIADDLKGGETMRPDLCDTQTEVSCERIVARVEAEVVKAFKPLDWQPPATVKEAWCARLERGMRGSRARLDESRPGSIAALRWTLAERGAAARLVTHGCV